MLLKFEEIDKQINNKLTILFPPGENLIAINPGNIILPKEYLKLCDKIKNFKVYKDDIWVISYPRTGSTWAQEMIWLLGNNFNFTKSKNLQLLRSPLLEFSGVITETTSGLTNIFNDSVECVKQLPRPRYIKTHLPLHLLPSELDLIKPKIIYTSRNLKDLALSYYHHLKLLHRMTDDFETYCDLFLSENIPPGSALDHMLSFWKKRDEENILFLKYEDMNRDLVGVIRKAAKFMEINEDEMTDERMNIMLEHLNFANMQKNPAVNLETILNNNENNEKFIRKGAVGDWKNWLSPEISERFDELIRSKLEFSGLEFQYE